MINVSDERKRIANLAKHGLDFADLTLDYFLSATNRPAHSGRRSAIGHMRGGVVTTIHYRLGSEALSVVSLRRSNKKEGALHEGV
jgi:uncharacterized DUF497 family protein